MLLLLLAGLLHPFGALGSPARYVEGELLVKFKGGSRGETAVQAQRAFQHEVKKNYQHVGWQRIKLRLGWTVADALDRYQRHPGVLAVQPNYEFPVKAHGSDTGVIPNDPLFAQQWALARIGATNAWGISTGSSNVVVAVIDSGVYYGHEDLAANMWTNRFEIPGNGLDDDGNGYIDDIHGIDLIGGDGDPMDEWFLISAHGTVCAGIIGAVGNNNLGIAGVNWSVQIMALRFLSFNGSGVTPGMFAELCDYILDQKQRGVNVRVTSSSWSWEFGYDPGPIVHDALQHLGEADILNVFAAGEKICAGVGRGTNLDEVPLVFPQSWHLPTMINVASSDKNEQLAFDSNYGMNTVDLAAPGEDIRSTTDYTQGGARYVSSTRGTSVACPHVAGAAALLAAAYPEANAGQLKTALILTADRVGNLINKVAAKGRLNLAAAITHPGLATNAPPFIFIQPQSQTNGFGCPTDFSAMASAPSDYPVTYQWQKNGEDIPNGVEPELFLPNPDWRDAGDYRLIARNDYGAATSAIATLVFADYPVILSEPQTVSVIDGSELSLHVSIAGSCPLALQWLHNGTIVPGATAATLDSIMQ